MYFHVCFLCTGYVSFSSVMGFRSLFCVGALMFSLRKEPGCRVLFLGGDIGSAVGASFS